MRVPVLIALFVLHAAAAVGAPTVSVLPGTMSVSTGEAFQLSVEVNAEAGGVSCFSVILDFDPSMLLLQADTEGLLFSDSLEQTFYQHEVNSQGDHIFSACVLGFGTTVAAPGQLFTVDFYGLNDGPTSVDVEFVELRDVDRALIPGVVGENASITINLTATPQASPRAAYRLLATPNPASAAVLFQLQDGRAEKSATEALRVGQVELFDVAGRRVAAGDMNPVGGGLRWDLRDRGGGSLATGMYFAVVRHGGRIVARTKLLVVD